MDSKCNKPLEPTRVASFKRFFGTISFVAGILVLLLCVLGFTDVLLGNRPEDQKSDMETFVESEIFLFVVSSLLIFCGLLMWRKSKAKNGDE